MGSIRYLAPGDPGSLLSADRRERDLATLPDTVDVLVVGGGITGVGVALDAATRGLNVILAEREDLAFGTSRWSSKLIHGGLRYLAKGDVTVAWESAVERAIVAGRIAPHLVRPLPQLVPAFIEDRLNARMAFAGMRAGDVLRVAARTPRGLLPGTRRVTAAEARRLVPALRDGLVGATLGWDCQLEDDARLVVAVARTAAAYGARILTYCSVDHIDPVNGVVGIRDTLTGTDHSITATAVVNATGVWADRLEPRITLAPSLGTHVVVPSALLGDAVASLTVPVPDHVGRFVFSLPKGDGLTYVGITDHALPGPVPDIPQAPAGDVHWILNVLSEALTRPLTADDVVGTFAGLRPLVSDEGHSADISRHHLILRNGRMTTITGGKLTTYRRMAADVVDGISPRPGHTRDIALVGAGPRPNRPDVPPHLWRRYGNEAPLVWDLGAATPHLRDRIVPDHETIAAELLFGRCAELAVSTDDLLDRRVRLGLLIDRDRYVAATERVSAGV